jgi:hypothetical protein
MWCVILSHDAGQQQCSSAWADMQSGWAITNTPQRVLLLSYDVVQVRFTRYIFQLQYFQFAMNVLGVNPVLADKHQS